ncbi:hypothetical protein ACFL2T_06015, partial [Elusimicrobiota bacterium]
MSLIIGPVHLGETRRRVLEAAVAVRLYALDARRLPATLAELTPHYLPSVPQDPFDGFQPLRYSYQGRTWAVYSQGPDRKDDACATSVSGGNEWNHGKEAPPGDICVLSSRG